MEKTKKQTQNQRLSVIRPQKSDYQLHAEIVTGARASRRFKIRMAKQFKLATQTMTEYDELVVTRAAEKVEKMKAQGEIWSLKRASSGQRKWTGDLKEFAVLNSLDQFWLCYVEEFDSMSRDNPNLPKYDNKAEYEDDIEEIFEYLIGAGLIINFFGGVNS